MVRSVIKKVALPPLTQNNTSGQQTSVVGQQTSDANKKGFHTESTGDTQSAFIDQSAHEFLNTTSKTCLNIDPNMGGLRCVLKSLPIDKHWAQNCLMMIFDFISLQCYSIFTVKSYSNSKEVKVNVARQEWWIIV